MLELLNSATANSAALRMDWPATPALPVADSGRIRPTLTSPVPMVAPGGAGAPWGGGVGEVNELRRLELPEQPASSVAAVDSKPVTTRRRDGNATGPWSGISADTAVLLTASRRDQQLGIANLSFWGPKVNQMERIMKPLHGGRAPR